MINILEVTDLVPAEDCLCEGDSELVVAGEDVAELVEECVHLGLGEDGRAGLLQRHAVVPHQPLQRGHVVVLAVDERGHDVPPLGLLRAQEQRRRRQRGGLGGRGRGLTAARGLGWVRPPRELGLLVLLGQPRHGGLGSLRRGARPAQ